MTIGLVDELKDIYEQLKQLRSSVKAQKTKAISKKEIRNKSEELGTIWFDKYSAVLATDMGVPSDVVDRYSNEFRRLIKISSPNNLKQTYLDILKNLCHSFRADLILILQQKSVGAVKVSQLNTMLSGLKDVAQSEYLKEAIACAERGYFRAAVVMGWCAAIDQIHRVIEKKGFANFNLASATMASQTIGRFKKFNQVQNVNSIGELREVFDPIVLWILEGMQLIDSNEHTRLRSCFDLRCHCAHPGNAPITEYNLLSFFSDLNLIIFKNGQFVF